MLLNVDYQPLTTAEMLEGVIVDYLKQHGSRIDEGVKVSISREIASRTGSSGDVNSLMLPSNYQDVQRR